MSKKILIIDDNDDILRILTKFFSGKEYEVAVSSKALKIDEIKNIEPDLILLDVNLKGSEVMGNEICKELKTQVDTKHLPVLLLSGKEDLHTIALDCEANGFIQKPFNVNLLKSKVYDSLLVRW